MSRNRCCTECLCGWPLEDDRGADYVTPLMSPDDYLTAVSRRRPSLERYRSVVQSLYCPARLTAPVMLHKVVCPICLARYAGWYARDENGEWVLYDTSYYSTFDDEPGDEDLPLGRVNTADILWAWARAGRPR